MKGTFPEQLLLEINMKIPPFRKSFKCIGKLIISFKSLRGKKYQSWAVIFSLVEDSRFSISRGFL